MRAVCALLLVLGYALDAAVVIDRIAIIVRDRVIKDSDIERDLRVTSFLNGDKLEFTPEARRKAAERLIDQTLIRREVQIANYAPANPAEAGELLKGIRTQRFRSEAAYNAALKQYGITEEQLRHQLGWQVTVLHFIEQRFRPGVQVTEEEVERYFNEQRARFQQASGKKPVTLETVRGEIEEQIAGERVNTEFFGWLEGSRKGAEIEYREAALR